MRALLLLTALLARVAAPTASGSSSSTETCCSSTITTTIRPIMRTSPPRRKSQGKADSPMLNYIFDSYATSNKHFHDKFRAPSFEGSAGEHDTVVEADTGATVLFDCKVNSLRDKMVAWLRVSENDHLELLTLDMDTHSADTRYRVELSGDDWKLSLSDAKVQDSGLFFCQVSTHPPLIRRVNLTVHPPELRMVKEAFLETGETLSLKCSVVHLHPGDSEPVMHWYRGNTTVPLDEVRGGVLIETDHMRLVSQLQVASVTQEDVGNYTCALESPIQMKATARVHVLQGSSLAELQSGVRSRRVSNFLLILSLVASKTLRSELSGVR